jgi:dihydrofolate reductase
MRKLVAEITMSLDGFIAGPHARPGQGLGEGGEQLHEWVYGLKSWREPHGLEGGETGPDAEMLEQSISRSGAIIVGRTMYDHAEGWGDRPPFGRPVFVLTHRGQEPLVKDGGTTFTFVTDGIESALAQAKAAAGDKDVAIGGGASVIQQYFAAGLLDELMLHIAPILLGDGKRLFDQAKAGPGEFEPVQVIGSPKVTHLRYRINRP